MSEDTQNLITMMEERIESLKAKGDWDGAVTTAMTTVQTAHENYELDPSTIGEYAYSMEILGNVCRDHSERQRAIDVYSDIIRLLENEEGYYLLKGRVSANLAIIHEDQEMFDEAKDYYKWGLHQLTKADDSKLEQSGVLNNLAFLYEGENRYEEAEDLFLKALKLCHDELGSNHESTADIWNNLGGLFYKSKKFSRSLEMHKSALDVRKEVLGEGHEDTAQSWGNLAIVYVEMEDVDLAKECFNNALNILEQSSEARINDYATINANFVHILNEQGYSKEADAIEKRVSKFIKNHS